ncbi:MAG: MMPL family transporter [Planctomycetaceae bacterium]
MKTIIRFRNLLLAIAALAVLVAIPFSERLSFDQRIESFFADDHSDVRILKRSQADFGSDEFVIVAWSEPQLFALEGQAAEAGMSLEQILDMPDLVPTLEEAAAERIRVLAGRLNAIPGVRPEKTRHLAGFLQDAPRSRNTRRALLRLFEGTLVGADGHTTGIILVLDPAVQGGSAREAMFDGIRKTAADFSSEAAVAGEPVQVFDMFQMVEQDSRQLFIVSLVILSAVLLTMFRSLRWMLAPVGLVLGSVVATRALLYASNLQLSMVGSMLNSLLTVIGIATVMHVIVHYRDLRLSSPGDDIAQRIMIAVQTLRELGWPVFWTCATTAVGFGSLFVSRITPVRSFAMMMCLATAVVLVACAAVLPATLASGRHVRIPPRVPLESWLDRILAVTCSTLNRHPISTALACLLIIGAAVPGIFMLTIETDFSRNFRESSSIVQSLRFVESHLGPAGSWEVAFDAPEELTDEFLEDISELTERLRLISPDRSLLQVLSLTDITDLPPRIFGPVRTLERMKRQYPELIRSFYNPETHRMRIVLRSREQQPSESKERMINEVKTTVENFFFDVPEGEAGYTASGMFVLLTRVIESLNADQLNSFLCASTGILISMTIAFRSLRIGLISLLPNIFPVAVLLGSLGWLGIPTNIGTAMIASVSMGLTVDSTIHYITAFERARRESSITEALHIAHGSAGRAVVLAQLALVAGFLVLTASRFIPLVYFGALMSVSLVTGVFGTLVLLPVLLKWTTPAETTNA